MRTLSDAAYFSLNESERTVSLSSAGATRRSLSASELPLLIARVNRLPSAVIWLAMLLLRAGGPSVVIFRCSFGVEDEGERERWVVRACRTYIRYEGAGVGRPL